jgi:hypothetical protein
MPKKVYSEWVNEDELLQVIHLTPRVLRDLRRAKKIPFKKANQKRYLYNIDAVLAALPGYDCKPRQSAAVTMEVGEI